MRMRSWRSGMPDKVAEQKNADAIVEERNAG